MSSRTCGILKSKEPGEHQVHPQSTGLEVAEAHRLLQGHSQPRESAGNGGNWEEKLGQTPLEPRVKPLMEPPPLVAGEFLLPVFPTLESSLEHSMNLVVNPLSLELDWESRQGSDSQNRFQADFVPFFFFFFSPTSSLEKLPEMASLRPNAHPRLFLSRNFNKRVKTTAQNSWKKQLDLFLFVFSKREEIWEIHGPPDPSGLGFPPGFVGERGKSRDYGVVCGRIPPLGAGNPNFGAGFKKWENLG